MKWLPVVVDFYQMNKQMTIVTLVTIVIGLLGSYYLFFVGTGSVVENTILIQPREINDLEQDDYLKEMTRGQFRKSDKSAF